MADDMASMVYQELKNELTTLQEQTQINAQVERALFADSCPAYLLVNAPNNSVGGMGNMVSYVTFAWISDGRKSGEGAGVGTGVLAVFQSSTNQWLRLTDYTVVVT